MDVEFVPEELPGTRIDDNDEADYEPSEVADGEGEDENKEALPDDPVMVHGDCESPELTFLTFGVGIPNNQSKESASRYCPIPSSPWTTRLSFPR